MRASMAVSPWALAAMTPEAREIARRLSLVIVGDSPRGPWAVQCPGHRWDGRDVNALVLQAAKEITS